MSGDKSSHYIYHAYYKLHKKKKGMREGTKKNANFALENFI